MYNRIKEVIAEKNTTSAEVADKMGIKPEALSRSINGNPTLKTLYAIAEALEVPVTYLLQPPEWCPYCGQKIEIKNPHGFDAG